MSLLLLDHSFAWFGKHAGIGQLGQNLSLNGCPNKVIRPRRGILARIAGKAYSAWMRHPNRDQALAASECEFALRMRLARSPGHVLILEDHIRFLSPPSKHARWIGTMHLPRRCWKESDLEYLRALPEVIVLSENVRDEFSDIFNRSQIKVLPHGVDTDFFRPWAASREARPRKFIFVGAWLRNTAMLARVIPEISRRFPDVIFDLVVPLFARQDPAIRQLSSEPSVRWYHNLSDEDLRTRYQTSTAMLMPMEDSGANNAVVEALACGLPIITTDTGGIRSYGGGEVFPLVKNNDDAACLGLAEAYLNQPEFAARIGRECRAFAETRLAWEIAAKEYIAAYQSLGFV